MCVEVADQRERVKDRQQHAAGEEPGVETEGSDDHAGDLAAEDIDLGCAMRRAAAREIAGHGVPCGEGGAASSRRREDYFTSES